MKLMTRDTDYALRALCYIAKKRKSIVSAQELVKSLKMPKPFLRKILQILNKKKLLKSSKGQGGGFALAVAPSEISLLSLIEVFQGRLQLNECSFKKVVCSRVKICKVKKKIDSIQKFVVAQLKGVTVASLLRKGV